MNTFLQFYIRKLECCFVKGKVAMYDFNYRSF